MRMLRLTLAFLLWPGLALAQSAPSPTDMKKDQQGAGQRHRPGARAARHGRPAAQRPVGQGNGRRSGQQAGLRRLGGAIAASVTRRLGGRPAADKHSPVASRRPGDVSLRDTGNPNP